MLKTAVIWFALVGLLLVSGACLWDLRRFARAHRHIDRDHGLPAYCVIAKRQMWCVVGMMVLLAVFVLSTYFMPGPPPSLVPMLAFIGLMTTLGLFSQRAQKVVRGLPCTDEGVRLDRDAVTATWMGTFLPPRSMKAAMAEARSDPAATLDVPDSARITGITTILLVVIYYLGRIVLPQDAAMLHPFGFVLQHFGVMLGAGLVTLGLLTKVREPRGRVVPARHRDARSRWLDGHRQERVRAGSAQLDALRRPLRMERDQPVAFP